MLYQSIVLLPSSPVSWVLKVVVNEGSLAKESPLCYLDVISFVVVRKVISCVEGSDAHVYQTKWSLSA